MAEFTDLGVDAMTSAQIRFKNGARASFDVGMILGENTNSRYDRLYIHGTKGSIRSEVEYNREGDVSYRVYSEGKVTERKVSIPQNYALETAQMCRCIEGLETPHITPEFSLKNAKLIDDVLKAIGYY